MGSERSVSKGFTLIEVLLAVTLVGILATSVVLAISPEKQLMSARNSQRQSDVTGIMQILQYYAADHAGGLPIQITPTPGYICRTGVSVNDCAGLVDLRILTDQHAYVYAWPVDPTASTTVSTGYLVSKDVNGTVFVTAPGAEGGVTIMRAQ